jgi:demethylmenaquinone methyltransferase/2-methoxy-6-polyprenyl-1,4-benzoquinol methylase
MNSEPSDKNNLTDFGFTKVPVNEKARKVAEVFASVAPKYDVMNDLMSMGLHRVWKRFAIGLVAARPGQVILDLASGTGDLAALLAKDVGAAGRVLATDINAPMLGEGRRRLTNRGIVGNIEYVQANAEKLPFPSNHFHAVTIAFGLRNVTNKATALAEMYRVLKPGGQLVVLEFSQPIVAPLRPIYDAYSFKILPAIGRLVANDAESYRYLAESIRMHPDQEKLKEMMRDAGFGPVEYFNLAAGIVAAHRGFKI